MSLGHVCMCKNVCLDVEEMIKNYLNFVEESLCFYLAIWLLRVKAILYSKGSEISSWS